MERVSVSSTNIVSIGYDAPSATLEAEFRGGGIYQYFGVPEDLYQGLMASSSKGTFLNQYVKNAGYAYSKV